MKKSVLISIQPKQCELILLGKKVLEVRKTRPKTKTPFKCYIYQTKAKERLLDVLKDGDDNYGETYHGKSVFIKTFGEQSGYKGLFCREQKIIGEFVCDTFVTDKTFGHDPLFNGAACMREVDAVKYSCQSPLYGWHISSLVIYDKAKELSDFYVYCDRCDKHPISCEYAYEENTENGYYSECGCDFKRPIKRPPQSWCYVDGFQGSVK